MCAFALDMTLKQSGLGKGAIIATGFPSIPHINGTTKLYFKGYSRNTASGATQDVELCITYNGNLILNGSMGEGMNQIRVCGSYMMNY